MFYDHKNSLLLKVLGSVIYGIMGKYVCLYDFCAQQEHLSSNDISFKDTTFDDSFCISIPEILMNIMSCDIFNRNTIQLSF